MNFVRTPIPFRTSCVLPTCTVSGMAIPARVEACKLSMDPRTNTVTKMTNLRMEDSFEKPHGTLPGGLIG